MSNSCTLVRFNIGIDNEMKTYPKEDLGRKEENVENSTCEGMLLCQ